MAEGIAHPRSRDIACRGGEFTITVRPWTMGQRAEWRPRVEELLSRLSGLAAVSDGKEIVALLLECEDLAARIAEVSVARYPEGKGFGDLELADCWAVCQAVWELNFQLENGPVGKLIGLIRPRFMAGAAGAARPDQPARANGADSPDEIPNQTA